MWLNNNELYHYGRKGMRWYQNIFSRDKNSSTRKKTKTSESDTIQTSTKKSSTKSKNVKSMTSEELKQRIERLKLEKELRDLDPQLKARSRGKEFVIGVLENIGKNTLTNIGTQAATHFLGVAINKAAKVDSKDAINRIVNPQKGQADKK